MADQIEPARTPLWEAQHAQRYDRQEKIREYEKFYDCRLVVIVDAIFPASLTLFEELLFDIPPNQELHILVSSPGGDGESAVRILRSAHSRCRKLVVLVPDQAKSAATLIALGADEIVMGPTGDLGPIDPQMELPSRPGSLVAAKDIISAVEDFAKKVQDAPETYPLYASLLSEVTAILLQQAKSALGRTQDLLKLALESNPRRKPEEVQRLFNNLHPALIGEAKTHTAIFGAKEAKSAGLPVKELAPDDPQWMAIWRLWTRYAILNRRVYESARASQEFEWARR
jgi:hypothetical protein